MLKAQGFLMNGVKVVKIINMKEKTHDINFLAYLDGDLNAEQNSIVQTHLEECPECSEALKKLQNTYVLLDERPELNPNPFLFHKVKNALVEEKKTQSTSEKLWQILRPVAVAGSILMGIYLGSPVESELANEEVSYNLEADLLFPDLDESLLTLNIE